MKALIAVLSLAALPVALVILTRVDPSEAPTIEQLLPLRDVATIERFRGIFGSEPDVVLVALAGRDGPLAPERLQDIETEVRRVDGVTRTWSLPETGRPASVIALALEPGTVQLTRARTLTAGLQHALARVLAADETAHVAGTPQLRAATWEVARDDLLRMLPLLVLTVVLVPLAFFGAIGAALFPLVMAALTTAACVIAYRLFTGPLNALVMLLVPILWSVATLDALHLYFAVRRKADRGHKEPVAAARADLFRPCLITTLTTAGGLAALALQDESRLIRSFGIWAAAGTILAFLLTFTVGSTLLTLARSDRPLPRWPTRLALSVTMASQRRASVTLVVWIGLLVAAGVFASRLRLDVRFPHVLEPGHKVARELRAAESMLGVDLSPLEIYVEPTDEQGRGVASLASALMIVTHYVGTFPETRLVLPQSLLEPNSIQVGDNGTIEEQLLEFGEDPRMQPWIRFDREAARLQVHFAPLSLARREELIRWLEHFDKTMLSHHKLTLGGPAYHYLLAERRGLRGTWVGGLWSLAVVALALAWSFRGPRLLGAALVGNLAPLLLVAGVIGAAGMPWSLALIPLPAILLGLAVDDTVHLLWPLRGRARRGRRILAKGIFRAGPALLATTVILAGCVGTMTLSGLQLNRELGLLLPAGLFLALLCDLSLVPALLTFSRRRSIRPRR